MKTNQLTLSAQPEKRTFRASIQSWLNGGNDLMSLIMDDYITNRQALLIVNVLISLALLVAFAASSPLVVLAIAGWLVVSLSICKKGGLK